MNFHPILLFGRGTVIMPKNYVSADDPGFKVIQMRKLVLHIHVDPVGQREMAGRDMNVHNFTLSPFFTSVDGSPCEELL